MTLRTGYHSGGYYTSIMVLAVLYTTAGGKQEENQQSSSLKLGTQGYVRSDAISPTPTVTFEIEPSLLSSSQPFTSDEPVEANYPPSLTNEPVLSTRVKGTSALTTGYTQSWPLPPLTASDVLGVTRLVGDALIGASSSPTPAITESQAFMTNEKPKASENIADDISIYIASNAVDIVVISTIMHSSNATVTSSSSSTPTVLSSNSLIASTISELNTSQTAQDDFTSASNASFFSSPAPTPTTDNLTAESITRSGPLPILGNETMNSANEVIAVYNIDGTYSINILMPCLVGISLIVLAYKLIQRAWNYNNKLVVNKRRSVHIRDLKKLGENGNQFSERDPQHNQPVTLPSNKDGSKHIVSGSSELQEIYVENPAFSFEDIETTQL